MLCRDSRQQTSNEEKKSLVLGVSFNNRLFSFKLFMKKYYKNHTPKPTRPIEYTLYNTPVPTEK